MVGTEIYLAQWDSARAERSEDNTRGEFLRGASAIAEVYPDLEESEITDPASRHSLAAHALDALAEGLTDQDILAAQQARLDAARRALEIEQARTRGLIIAAYLRGMPQVQIAKKLGIARKTVQRALKDMPVGYTPRYIGM